MSFFLLPEVHSNIDKINIISDPSHNLHISLTLSDYLNKVKEQIDNNFDNWDFIKKYTNPYEFIHTIVPSTKYSISKLKTLSRSFYKMIEISKMLNIFDDYTSNPIKTFHLAEGPGGFIEATKHIRQEGFDTYYGMTLINEDPNVPGWKKSNVFLENNTNVVIEKGITETGDLLDVENLKYCYNKYNNQIEVITADGGFDFSIDFNKQELLATNLLYAEVCFALAMQKEKGHFILKIFDLFTKCSIDLIYILSTFYKQVFIVKPNSSRLANSEKYIVCKYFKRPPNYSIFMNDVISKFHLVKTVPYISCLLDYPIDYYFKNKIEEYNAIFGQHQIENIVSTLGLISCKNKTDKLENYKKNNIQKCVWWCEKYNIPCNKNISQTNIFIN